MSRQLMRAAALLGALAGTTAAGCADAQAGQGGLAARVAAAPEGEVWMHFASRPGVCGSENGISTSSSHSRGRNYVTAGEDDGDGRWGCVEGPVWVALERRGGRIEKVRMKVARGWSTEGRGRVTDLGAVGAREASEYLLALTERAEGRVGEEAIVPATLADSVTTWPALLRLTRNEALPQQTRRSAVFWLGQQAGDRVTRELSAFVNESDDDREVRKHAVFALSQRPRDEAVPELVRIARSHRDPEIRKTAMFWLGQSGDPRAIALFEEILRN